MTDAFIAAAQRVVLLEGQCYEIIRFRPFTAITLAFASAQAPVQPKPLLQAHAHNDYQHQRPLLDALDHGFCSVEADVHLVDGQFLVAHDRSQVKPERTLQALYLDPLRERVQKNGGRVYPRGPEFSLLVELKGDWHTSYPVLREVLKGYTNMLTSFRAGKADTKAVTVIITGHRARKCSPANPSVTRPWTAI